MSVITKDKSTQQLLKEWKPVLDGKDKSGKLIEGLEEIKEGHRRAVTARLLENQEQASTLQESVVPSNAMMTGQVATWDPVLISMVRRAVPKMIAFDIFGVQPMSGPTGLVFAMTSHYGPDAMTGAEALWGEADTGWSGKRTDMTQPTSAANANTWEGKGTPDGTVNADGTNSLKPTDANVGYGIAMGTGDAELLGSTNAWNEMSFKIVKDTVEAKSRGLRTTWTVELTQDLKAVHGLDAETELANILSTEILNEINREMVRRCYVMAQDGAQNCATPGTFDLQTDSDGRWAVEKFKGLMFQIEREQNEIAINTRRGKGNFMIVSANVASALAMTGLLDTSGNRNGSFIDPGTVDPTGTTYVGILNGRTKVFVDPYVAEDFCCTGYKGVSQYDAGAFYCPYVPLQLYRAILEDSYQPSMGFKTRYGFIAHPLEGGKGQPGQNLFYRIFKIANL